MKKNKCGLVKDDVKRVADDLHISVTDEQIELVLKCVDDEAERDPTGDWQLWVENLLYQKDILNLLYDGK